MSNAVSNCNFETGLGRNQWHIDDFIMVKGPRWTKVGSWIQEDDHIVQNVPADATDKDLHDHMCDEAYVAMCYGKKVRLDKQVVCTSTMSFDDRMAPLLVIAPELGTHKESGSPEFREHWEIVLYDLGINVWQHLWIDEKPDFIKFAHMDSSFDKKTRHELKITISDSAKGQMLDVECDGRKFGCYLPGLGKEFYLGIIGCEGRNRFYDFKISAPAE